MLIILLAIIPSCIQSEINEPPSLVLIDEVSFVGNHRINQQTLEKLISVKKGDPYNEKELKNGLNRIIEQYLQYGLIFAEISPRIDLKEKQAQICVQIHEGETAKFDNISIVGNTKFTTAYLLSLIGLSRGKPVNMTSLEKGIKRILNLYLSLIHI